MWYRKIIGGKTAPIVDTWWQTETGAMMVSALPGVTVTKPGSAQVPLPGVSIDVVDDDGVHVGNGNGGLLVVTEPWPSMLRGIWGDPERFKETYWDKFAAQGYYFAGDGARLDDDGDVWFLGRVDDVMNVSGHRLSTTEIESALVGNEAVAEAAVVGASDETTGQAVVAFVIVKQSYLDAHSPEGLAGVLRQWVGEQIGAIARPRDVYIVGELPKTRSGKIMRRLLRDVAEGREVGDTTTLADTAVMECDLGAASGRSGRGYTKEKTTSTSTGESSGSTGTPTADAGVAPRLAEDLAEQLARAVDHAGLTGELGDGCHEAGDLDDAGQAVDSADGMRRGGERVQRARCGRSPSRHPRRRRAPTLPVAGRAPDDHRQLTGGVDEVAVHDAGMYAATGGTTARKVDAELDEALRDAHHAPSNCCAACAAAPSPTFAAPTPTGRLR